MSCLLRYGTFYIELDLFKFWNRDNSGMVWRRRTFLVENCLIYNVLFIFTVALTVKEKEKEPYQMFVCHCDCIQGVKIKYRRLAQSFLYFVFNTNTIIQKYKYIPIIVMFKWTKVIQTLNLYFFVDFDL